MPAAHAARRPQLAGFAAAGRFGAGSFAAGWFSALDAGVAALHRNGFLQSLILHVAGLLALSLTVIPPLAPGREVRLDVAFAAAPATPVDIAPVTLADEDLAPTPPGGASSPGRRTAAVKQMRPSGLHCGFASSARSKVRRRRALVATSTTHRSAFRVSASPSQRCSTYATREPSGETASCVIVARLK